MRILIADDHAVVRRGLIEILGRAFAGASFGEARNPPEVLECLRKGTWDAILLDITMPGKGGLELLKDIKATHPKLPVLVLSMHPEDQYARRALRAGAAGYLTKESASGELVVAIKQIVQGGRYVSQSLAENLASDLDAGAAKPLHEQLTDREYQVMCSIASGKAVRQIADELSLGLKTVGTYRARVLRKMNMRTDAELTRYAVENGLI